MPPYAGHMYRDIDRVLIDRKQIAARVHDLASELAGDLVREMGGLGGEVDDAGDLGQVVFIPILTGAIVFVADLIRHLPFKLRLELVAISSYPGRSMTSRGAAMRSALPDSLGGRHVVIVDDILDSGRTLGLITALVREQSPASVRTCVLLDKKVSRAEAITPDYAGFEIPDEFVVGYGLDYDGYYRNHPDIAVLHPDAVGPAGDDKKDGEQ